MGDLLTHLRDARAAGLRISVRSGRLKVTGPRSAARIVGALGEHKTEVVALVEVVSALIGATSPDDEALAAARVQPRCPWRNELPRWSVEWRERWGRRANELAEAGVPWPEDGAKPSPRWPLSECQPAADRKEETERGFTNDLFRHARHVNNGPQSEAESSIVTCLMSLL